MKQIIAFTNKSDQNVDNLKELYLPCPRSNRRSIYFCNEKGELYETQQVTGAGRKASWLIDSNIYKDGAVRFITAIDPLFITLPLLQQASTENKFKDLDDIFTRENVTLEVSFDNECSLEATPLSSKPIDVHRLINVPGLREQLGHVCDIREIASGLHVYRLNETKTLHWLEKKVDRLLSNPTFKVSFKKTELDENMLKLEAVYTLSNYLSKEWFTKLLTKLELKEETQFEMDEITSYVTDVSPSGYFKRVHPEEKLLDGPAKKKKPDAPRSLAKVNTKGMKSITSFFQKK